MIIVASKARPDKQHKRRTRATQKDIYSGLRSHTKRFKRFFIRLWVNGQKEAKNRLCVNLAHTKAMIQRLKAVQAAQMRILFNDGCMKDTL